MHRQTVYPGAIPLETDILNTNVYAMEGIGRLLAAILGTGGIVSGLAVGPNTPAALNVIVAAGEVYQLGQIDTSAYSSLPVNTTPIIKQGINEGSTQLSITPPGTAGYSINYLIEAAFLDADINSVVLPYYNAANPSQAYQGPNNNGQQQSTERACQVQLLAKAGAQAPTGSQVTPSPDAGFMGIAVVTVANGQTTITSANITPVTTNTLPAGMLQSIQSGQLNFALDTGAANAYVANCQPAITALTNGLTVAFKALNANSGASTLNLNGLGASPILGGAHSALQGGEIVVNGYIEVEWNVTLNSWVLLENTGGATQVGAATKSNQAMQLGQATGRFLGVQIFPASGTYTPGIYGGITATRAKFRLCGGGGGGGGAQATNASQAAVANGGNGGEYKEYWVTSGLAAQTITIGAGGAGGAAGFNNGSQGGTTSVGALVSAVGGNGGAAGAATTPPYINVGQGNNGGGTPAAPLTIWRGAELGGYGITVSATQAIGGQGGNSPFGAGQKSDNSVTAGQYGAGGGGAFNTASSAALAGGNGFGGYVLVEEYA